MMIISDSQNRDNTRQRKFGNNQGNRSFGGGDRDSGFGGASRNSGFGGTNRDSSFGSESSGFSSGIRNTGGSGFGRSSGGGGSGFGGGSYGSKSSGGGGGFGGGYKGSQGMERESPKGKTWTSAQSKWEQYMATNECEYGELMYLFADFSPIIVKEAVVCRNDCNVYQSHDSIDDLFPSDKCYLE